MKIPSISEYGDIDLLYDDESHVFLIQKRAASDPNEDDAVGFHVADIPGIIDALNERHMTWKRANSDLYRDPATTTKGEA